MSRKYGEMSGGLCGADKRARRILLAWAGMGVLDLNDPKPHLYVVENELAAHDPLRHIAVQILQFSLSFEAEPRTVRNILFEALQSQADLKLRCEDYAAKHSFRNLDHLLDYLVFETPFAALVIIDEIPDNLEKMLLARFRFGVEVMELA